MTDELEALIDRGWTLVEEGRRSSAWNLLQRHRQHLTDVPELAFLWVELCDQADENCREDLEQVLVSFAADPVLVERASRQLILLAEQDPMDEPPPGDSPAMLAARAASGCLGRLAPDQRLDPDLAAPLYAVLGTALHLAGSEHDSSTLAALERAVDLDPDNGWWWFNLGLFHKWRGRWREGLDANLKARELIGDDDSLLWNLGICATGAGDGFVAAEAWLALGYKSRPGPDGLPRMDLAPAQVRVSSVAQGVDPRLHAAGTSTSHELLWVQPWSPCHGLVLTPAVYGLAADYGDLVLWDGAPVGYHQEEGIRSPQFPLLQRISPGDFHRFWFLARQTRSEAIHELGETFPEGAFLYVHNEIGESPDLPETRDEQTAGPEPQLLAGKIIAPGSMALDTLCTELQDRLREHPDVDLAAPDLMEHAPASEANHDHERLWEALNRSRGTEPGIAPDANAPSDPAGAAIRGLLGGSAAGAILGLIGSVAIGGTNPLLLIVPSVFLALLFAAIPLIRTP